MPTTTQPASPGDLAVNRVVSLVIMVCCGGLLTLAAVLKPSDAGVGTHQQMGLPPCGFKHVTGYPCATCGCTTAFAHAANGSLLDAFLTQPFGAVLAVAVAMLTLVAGWSAVSGMPLAPLGRVVLTKRVVLSGIALLLLAWAYKAMVVVASA